MSQLPSSVFAHEKQTKAEEPQRNWARTITYNAVQWHHPETVKELQEIVSHCDGPVKALGSRHSFSSVADTYGHMISFQHFVRETHVDHKNRRVTVSAGVCYGEICHKLDQEGFAFQNMGSLPHISIAGACSTGTHGSGEHNGTLSTSVAALEFVAASGELVKLSRDTHSEQFSGAVVSLGGLGVITKLTLDVVPAFTMCQYVYENMPWRQLEAHFDEVQAKAYSVSLFPDWNPDNVSQVWVKYVVDEDKPFTPENEWFGATLATEHVTPFLDDSAANCTEQGGKVGRWYERLPHFRVELIPGKGEELQSEYFVPREHAIEALRAIRTLREQIQPRLFSSEVRTIAADDLWMSPAYQRDCISIGFTWKPEVDDVGKLLPHVEAKLAPFAPRAHWGKVSAMERSQVQAQYPKLRDFQELLKSFDPKRKFRNPYLEKHIYPDS